jgi:hypothetical protein
MNSVDIAAFIANDDAEYLGDVAAIALIAGTTVMPRAIERSRGDRRAHGGSPLGRKPNRDRGLKETGNLLKRQYFCRTSDATPMFTDPRFERRFRKPRTTYETVRPAVPKTSKFKAVYKQAQNVWCHPCPLPTLPAPVAALPSRPPYVATVVEGAGDGVREARREFPATGKRGIGGGGGGHGAHFCATAPSVHTLSESANGLVLRETS